MAEFVHLHVHTEYSLREGALRIVDLVQRAKEWGMPAVAITDTNALYGAVRFYRAAQDAGVKPIIGVQLSVAADDADSSIQTRHDSASQLETSRKPQAETRRTPEESSRRPQMDGARRAQTDTVVLLAENLTGYHNLVRLVTLAHERLRQPHVTFAQLATACEGVIALVGGSESLIMRSFQNGDDRAANRLLENWLNIWPQGALYIDVQDHGLTEERRALPSLVRFAREKDVPLVATNDVHYLDPSGCEIQRILAQLEGGEGAVLQGDRHHFASEEEMERRYAKLPEALFNTLEIADRCNLELPLGQAQLPVYPTSSGEPADVVLERAASAGVRQRYGEPTEEVQQRLQYELSIIRRMGFSDYFLVVADFIRYAHKQGISTGPGRGSAAGSLVAYALRITDVDPIRHDLVFERFLNPERVSWPDIDTDFEYERRGEVIQYVVERYGRDYVAQIGTFGTLAARAAIRDCGRVLKIDAKLVDTMAKLIPGYPGVTLQAAREEVPTLAALIEQPEARRLWDAAVGIEGFVRHTSIHAAGVVISPQPLHQLVPVQPGGDGVPVTQYAMEDIERIGLIKIDFLGLRTLTLIDRAVASIELRTGQKLDWRTIDENDEKTYQMLSKGDSDGCFQLESSGMRRVLRDLKPTRFEDIVQVTALYRPGPMDNIPNFIRAKHGRVPVHYPHPDLEPILKDTYGVIVYQEQIMHIASSMAGFSLGQADLLRRAVSKKKREILDAERDRFVQGCLGKGYDEQIANEVYDLIVRFADYGFPRGHAAAYAVLAFRTAYLRANHPADFLAALMSMAMGDAAKLQEYERSAKKSGVQVLPPRVDLSREAYAVETDTSIRCGLLAIRNVGKAAVDSILAARTETPFSSLVDFLQRINTRVCNRKAVEGLVTAGALDAFFPDGVKEDVKLQMLEEAYAVSEAGRQSNGLNLQFESTDRSRGTAGANRGSAEKRDGTASVLFIRMQEGVTRSALAELRAILTRYPGETPVALYDGLKQKARVLPKSSAAQVTLDLVAELEELVGLGNAKLGRLP